MMKKPRILAGLLVSSLLLTHHAKADGWAYFFTDTNCQRTIAALPNGGANGIAYVGSETIFSVTHNNSIHLMCYDATRHMITGWPIPAPSSDQIDDPNLDERNVDIIALDNTHIVQVSCVTQVNNPTGAIGIRLVKINIVTGVVSSNIIRSNNSAFN